MGWNESTNLLKYPFLVKKNFSSKQILLFVIFSNRLIAPPPSEKRAAGFQVRALLSELNAVILSIQFADVGSRCNLGTNTANWCC